MINLIKRLLFLFKRKKLSNYFPKHLFWDVNLDKLDVRFDKDFIIERVLAYHMEDEEIFKKLEKLYSKKEIKKIALNSKQIFGNETIEFISKRYKLDPTTFSKYIYSKK